MPARKRRPKSGKPATQCSRQKPPKTAKSPSRKPQAGKAVAVRPLPAQPGEILFRVEGKMSAFGGPHGLGMAANEDLALFTKADLQNPKYAYLFLPAPPPGTSGLGRRLNPDQYNSPAAGRIPRHQRNPCGAPLRAWKIPRMAGRLMCSRLIPAARTASLAPYTRRQLSLPE